jgi:hypothetical protein
MQEEWWHEVHHQREGLLRAGDGDQRRRQRRGVADVDQGDQHELADNEQELGHELAEHGVPQRPEPVLHGEDRRRPRGDGVERRPVQLVLRGNLHHQLGKLLLAAG